jgi:polar amino acid transport system substrate-binding protein
VVAVADAEVANTAEETNETFFQSLKKTFYQNLIEENRYLLIVDGLKITAWISLFSILLGTLLAIIVCWMSMSPSLTLRSIAKVYINIMQGTPVLVFLLLMFYVVLAQSGMSAVIVSIITFSMNFAAYASEIFRHSIENIPHSQTEAGVALGFTKAQTFIYIVLPQALRLIMPSYKGEVISLVKTTSIVGYIAVADLTQAGDIIRSRTFDAFFPLILVAIVYFILAWLFSKVLDIIGNKIQEYKHIK